MDIESYTPRALTIATIYQPNRFDSSHNEHTTTVIRTLIPRYSFVNETSNLIVKLKLCAQLFTGWFKIRAKNISFV